MVFMDDKRFIGIFPTEAEAILKVQELKIQGYKADDIYAVAKNENEVSLLRGHTDVEVKSTDGAETGWVDRFMTFLSGEEPIRDALVKMNLSAAEIDRYYQEVERGNILLYVDKDYGVLYDSGANIVSAADPNLGPNPLNPPTDTDNQEEDYPAMNEREQVEIETNTDISQQANIDQQQKEKSDELQTKDNNPYTNADDDSRY